MIPNHPYSYPPAHTMVHIYVSGVGKRLGYYDGLSQWYTDKSHIELRVMVWSAIA